LDIFAERVSIALSLSRSEDNTFLSVDSSSTRTDSVYLAAFVLSSLSHHGSRLAAEALLPTCHPHLRDAQQQHQQQLGLLLWRSPVVVVMVVWTLDT
jgi:hypothetical protein